MVPEGPYRRCTVELLKWLLTTLECGKALPVAAKTVYGSQEYGVQIKHVPALNAATYP